MIGRPRAVAFFLVALGLLAGCAGPGPSAQNTGEGGQAGARPSRTLVLIARQETPSVSGTSITQLSFTTGSQRRVFNAYLAYRDANDASFPYLAESLPQLNTDSWQVLPDGRMQTTYRLKPGLVWHDGTPLSAEDFVMAWRVYTTPEFGVAGARPHNAMEQVAAPDSRSVAISWKTPYPDAGILDANFTPLPKHILESTLPQGADAFLNHAYWTTGFVGLGPYRLDRWDLGSAIEGSAFDGHALGRPKIDRIRIRFNTDQNAVLATMLAGEAQVAVDNSIRTEQALVLEDRWREDNFGTIQYLPTLWRWSQVQHRPEYANPKAILDLRVRKALTHAIDKGSINEAILSGKGIPSDTFVPPTVSYFPRVDRAVAKYPFDLRRSEQLMAEAGYRRGSDGFYTGPEGRPVFEVKVIASAQNDSERTVMADHWQRAGFAFEQGSFTPAETTVGEVYLTFRSLSTTSGSLGENFLPGLTSAVIGSPANGWRGSNRGGWSNLDYDRAVERFNTTLNRPEREQAMVDAARLVSEELAVLPLYFNPAPFAWPNSLVGVNIVAPTAELTWNVHTWELR